MSRQWTPEQAELIAVNASGQPDLLQVSVRADAGAGKTSVLVERVQKILNCPQKNGRVLCISFTERSKKDLETRLRKIAAAEVYTIHGFCRRVIGEFGGRIGLLPYPKVLDETQARALFESVFERVTRNLSRDSELRASGAISALGYSNLRFFADVAILKMDPVHGARVLGSGVSGRAVDALRGYAAQLQSEYEARKRRRNALDYGDLEKIALDLLKDEEVAQVLRARFAHLFVDEFQDTNYAQCGLVERLRSPEHGLFVVGDVKQSIYRFRGSDCRVFEDFAGAFEKQRRLSVNFRSHSDIIEAVNLVFQDEMPGFEPMSAGLSKEGQGCVQGVSAGSQADGVLAAVEKARADGHAGSDIMLLLRRVRGNEKLLEELKQRGLALVLSMPRSLPENETVFALTSLWTALQFPKLRTVQVHASGILGMEPSDLAQAAEKTRDWTNPQILRWLEERWNFRARLGLHWETFEELILTAHWGGHAPARIAFEFQRLWQDRPASGIFSIETKNLTPPAQAQNAIRVSTVHASKGLEFPVVILADLNERRTASRRITPIQDHIWVFGSDEDGAIDRSHPEYKTAMEEEKQQIQAESLRLLYVAMTRAQEQLFYIDVPNPKGQRSGWNEILHRKLADKVPVITAAATLAAVSPATLEKQEPLARTAPIEKSPPNYRRAGIAATDYAQAQLQTMKGEKGHPSPSDLMPPCRLERGDLFRRSQSVSKLSAADLGTEVHAFLQREDWSALWQFAKERDFDFSSLRSWLTTEMGGKIFLPLSSVSLSPSSARVEREWMLEWRQEGDTLVGAIDRLIVQPNQEIWIVDYKLVLKKDGVTPDGLREKYGAQLALYGGIVKKMTAAPRVRLFLLDLLATSGEVCIELSPDSATL